MSEMNKKKKTKRQKALEGFKTGKFGGFGALIGGGTAEKPTIKPTEKTSERIRKQKKSSFFGQS